MKTILIKPHHFMDIIKLYGTGIHNFVPDEKMGHDFYKVANMIIHNPDVPLRLLLYIQNVSLIVLRHRYILPDLTDHL